MDKTNWLRIFKPKKIQKSPRYIDATTHGELFVNAGPEVITVSAGGAEALVMSHTTAVDLKNKLEQVLRELRRLN